MEESGLGEMTVMEDFLKNISFSFIHIHLQMIFHVNE